MCSCSSFNGNDDDMLNVSEDFNEENEMSFDGDTTEFDNFLQRKGKQRKNMASKLGRRINLRARQIQDANLSQGKAMRFQAKNLPPFADSKSFNTLYLAIIFILIIIYIIYFLRMT